MRAARMDIGDPVEITKPRLTVTILRTCTCQLTIVPEHTTKALYAR
jgi:hypothetical protein